MLDNLIRTCAESTSGADRPCQRPDDHVDFRRIYILMLRDTSTGPPKDPKGPGLIENETKFVAEFQFDLITLVSVPHFMHTTSNKASRF